MGPGEEITQGRRVGGGQLGLAVAQRIDEEPVAPVGGDASGTRVRLNQVPGLFQGSQLVAHGGRRDIDTGRRGNRPEPTGWAVSMYSRTTAERMAAFRSSSICRLYRVLIVELKRRDEGFWGMSTRPMDFIRFLPSFCLFSSLFFRVMSPP